MNAYPIEVLGEDDDNGTMPANVEMLAEAVLGHRIVSCERSEHSHPQGVYGGNEADAIITLDNGKRVILAGSDDCCAFTSLNAFLLHPERVDHIITGVGTTGGYTKWHIYADLGDVLELEVDWSPGNPFYYGYGFEITVTDVPPAAGVSGNSNLTAMDGRTIMHALMELPEKCRYHGDDIEASANNWAYDGACCATGLPALHRRRAVAALARAIGVSR